MNALKFFRLLLRLFPQHFRERFGEELEQTFKADLVEASNKKRLLRFWLETTRDLVAQAAVQRFAGPIPYLIIVPCLSIGLSFVGLALFPAQDQNRVGMFWIVASLFLMAGLLFTQGIQKQLPRNAQLTRVLFPWFVATWACAALYVSRLNFSIVHELDSVWKYFFAFIWLGLAWILSALFQKPLDSARC